MGLPKPTFLIIGAQKCGTTWLHRHLREHPDIFMPAEKELEFFSYRGHLDSPGFGSYLEHFRQAGEAQAIGEATASYFWTETNSRWGVLPDGFQTDIPGTAHSYLGKDLKLIVTLRNPVERAVSAYLHYLAMGEIAADSGFEQALTYGGVLDMGLYARHLRNWLEYYPQHQIRVLIMEEDIQAKPVETLASLCRFLSVGNHRFSEESVRQTVYAGTRRVINGNGVFVTADESTAIGGNESYRDEDGQCWRQIISAHSLRKLNEIFRADVKDLDTILGTQLINTWELTG